MVNQLIMKQLSLFGFLFLLFTVACSTNNAPLVRDIAAFNLAVSKAKPGDVIRLANGVWTDTELLFEGQGTKENPIVLTAEEKGKVILQGASNLRMAGNYLEVSGLVFKNGFTPTSEVISFKKDKNNLAHNSRLTECVIDNFNNPERHEPDTWVAIYGKNNRIDHNHLVGKANRGGTMIVRLNTEESQDNNHLIDHNYFGPRQNLGSNGGETLRIGTSHYSLIDSNTQVVSNYFDRCNGEHEIISNKSGHNTYRDNVFYECTGTLTMRHGSGTLVEGNVFLGNHKPSTGGIRIINGDQTVKNNYGYGLTGYRFRGAFVIMNGVPNSPINRYHQVENAQVFNNTFIDSDHVQLCAGSDAERSAVPINSVMENNLFVNTRKDNIFTVYDDISGISFANNFLSENLKGLSGAKMKGVDFRLEKDKHGLLQPVNAPENTGASLSDELATKETTGVNWYSKTDTAVALSSGKRIEVAPGLNSLYEAVAASAAGDILVLSPGVYHLTKTLNISHPLSFEGSQKDKSKLVFEKKSLFEIQSGGSLSLENLIFDGEEAPDRTGNSVIATSKYSMISNYKLFVKNCDFVNLDVNHSYDAIRVFKNTFADTISIKNSTFKTISGNVMALNKETDDIGIYNAEYVIMENNVFSDIGGVALNLHRGGKDESTFGPFLQMKNNVFNQVGFDKRNRDKASVSLYGVQEIFIEKNIFNQSNDFKTHLVVGEPIVRIQKNNFYKTKGPIVTGDQKYVVENNLSLPPKFIDREHFTLEAGSVLEKQKMGIQSSIH